ncbi:GspE/PulE family protein [Ideonella sp. A 288]|uniref:GspE/PulE family protein n=1 Tax=Ideonella sp. A 288 TaxID=1962181 RepID=UPI000B4B2621|nr:GspE/PulE family protein [Ideonella sp. A 288]
MDTQPAALAPLSDRARGLPNSLEAVRAALLAPAPHRARHLGEALIERGLVDTSTLARMLEAQRHTQPHRLLGQMLVDAGVLSPVQLHAVMAAWMGVPMIDPRGLVPEPEALRRVPRALAEREGLLPLMLHGDALVIAVPDPWDTALLEQLRFACQQRVVPVMTLPGTLAPAVAQAYASLGRSAATAVAESHAHDVPALLRALGTDGAAADAAEPADGSVITESDNTLVRLVNALIADAVRLRASDIHIETSQTRPVKVRLRVDGELQSYLELPLRLRYALVGRLKIMADLDISEHRKPQDGKIAFARFGGSKVELRMVTVPTLHGLEDVVLRLLSGLEPMPIEAIGLASHNLVALRGAMAKAYGLILICGPTGCGKTTTLHSVMRELNTEKRKIWTAEDPVEITQDGLRQVQVNPRIGWTFAQAMRTFLRADPDVIMIGEMRDAETARIAVEASLTGHLVLSTLHTNSAPESITRLLEIGLDPFMFSDSLLAILAQRLVRRLCPHCRAPQVLDESGLQSLAHLHAESSAGRGDSPDALVARWRQRHADGHGRVVVYRKVGCPECDGQGYQGRIGLHELMLASEAGRELIRHRAPASEMQSAALAGGMVTLRQDGIAKVLAGLTDLAEVIAATNQ